MQLIIRPTFENSQMYFACLSFSGHILVMCFIAVPHVKYMNTNAQTYTHVHDRLYITFMQ